MDEKQDPSKKSKRRKVEIILEDSIDQESRT